MRKRTKAILAGGAVAAVAALGVTPASAWVPGQYRSLHANFNSVPFAVQGTYSSGGHFDLVIHPGWTWQTPSNPDSFYLGAGCYADMGYNGTSDGMQGGRFYGPRYVNLGFGSSESVWVSAHC